jgi:hypothetical protein
MAHTPLLYPYNGTLVDSEHGSFQVTYVHAGRRSGVVYSPYFVVMTTLPSC